MSISTLVDAPAPEEFGRYRLLGVLGQGGMARLYLAEQVGIEGFSKLVALKRVLPHLASDPDFRRMFLTEARLAARLEHPNVIATYELGEVDGQHFLSMEYLPGEDLAAVLDAARNEHPIPVEIAATIAQLSALGLHYAHELVEPSGAAAGIVHRDVNPSNIFVTYHGEVKLLDFGIAKVRSRDVPLSSGSFRGKLSYAAPEQLTGAQLDRRADVFCLGIVLWECLTGRRLFDGDTEGARVQAVQSRPIPKPSLLRPELPPELDAITLKALARRREDRFQTAHELAEALDAALGRRPGRPTAKELGRWLELLFGRERAEAKRSIALGRNVPSALAQLQQLPPPRRPHTGSSSGVRLRAAWSTEVGASSSRPARIAESGTPAMSMGGVASEWPRTLTGSSALELPFDDPSLTRAPVRRRIGAITGGALLLASGLALVPQLVPSAGDNSPAARSASATLIVSSEPSGALIFVDGEPTGLVTPTHVHGLSPSTEIMLRLERSGHLSSSERVDLPSSGEIARHLTLPAALGTLELLNSPPGAVSFVDGRPQGDARRLVLPVGAHMVRVELRGQVLLQREVEIAQGEQTLTLP